jgi:hypothetical protein
MQYSSRLISNVRALFGIGRVLFACLLFAIPLMTFTIGGRIPQDLGVVYFKNPALKLKGATEQTRPPMLENLRAEISLPALTAEDRSIVRRIGLIDTMVVVVFAFLTCHWLWQLCRNVENGEVFSSTNLKLVRRMGALLIVEAVVLFGVNLWKVGVVATYVRDRVSFAGLELLTPTSGPLLLHPEVLEPNINQIIIGALVLCLAEVFRQGLKLKQEAELTV